MNEVINDQSVSLKKNYFKIIYHFLRYPRPKNTGGSWVHKTANAINI